MRLTSKGQVTIPQALREQFHLHPHTEIHFEAVEDGVLIRPAQGVRRRRMEAWLGRARGRATTAKSTKEIMRLTREED